MSVRDKILRALQTNAQGLCDACLQTAAGLPQAAETNRFARRSAAGELEPLPNRMIERVMTAVTQL